MDLEEMFWIRDFGWINRQIDRWMNILNRVIILGGLQSKNIILIEVNFLNKNF